MLNLYKLLYTYPLLFLGHLQLNINMYLTFKECDQYRHAYGCCKKNLFSTVDTKNKDGYRVIYAKLPESFRQNSRMKYYIGCPIQNDVDIYYGKCLNVVIISDK